VEDAIKCIKSNGKIVLEGICSHLSDADGQDSAFTDGQISVWNNIVNQFSTSIPSIKYFHLSNTYGHLYSKSIKANVSRLGIGMYGLADALRDKMDLQPILQMKTIITSVKKIKMGDTVGYNNTFKSDRSMTIATIPVGYYEGLDRRLSNIGAVEILPGNITCPIIGRVSMNITSIDVSNIRDIKIGTEVIVVSNNSNSKCSIEAISKLCNTITYESSIMFPENLKRVVVE
jgi:alanine racemase